MFYLVSKSPPLTSQCATTGVVSIRPFAAPSCSASWQFGSTTKVRSPHDIVYNYVVEFHTELEVDDVIVSTSLKLPKFKLNG